MGDCRYCGEPAGWLRRSHRQCRELHDAGVEQIANAMGAVGLDTREAGEQIAGIAKHHRVRGEAFTKALSGGWARCIEQALARDGVTRADETRLDALLAHFGAARAEIDNGGLWAQVEARRRREAEARVARLVSEGMHAVSTPAAGGRGTGAAPAGQRTLEAIEAEMESSARDASIPAAELRALVVAGIEAEMDKVLDDGLLSADEEQAIESLAQHFDIGAAELDRNGARTRLMHAGVLRDLSEGILPQRLAYDRLDLPFRFMKSETLVWLFKNVDYYTVRTRREIQGRTAGVSVRVARGVYFRTGGFKGRPVEYEESVHEDTGLLGVTTKHIYFAGSSKRFRIRHERIVSIEPYTDGIGIQRDAVRAKPETFRIGDGWFAYNLLKNIEVP